MVRLRKVAGGAVRRLVWLALTSVLTAVVAYVALPLLGALAIMNAGATTDMSWVTLAVMVLAPDAFITLVAVAGTVGAARGIWRGLRPLELRIGGDAEEGR